MNTYIKKIIIVAVGFCSTSVFGMITQQEQPILPSYECIEKCIDSSNELTEDTTLACFLYYTPKNTQEPVFFANTIQPSVQNFQQEQQPKKPVCKKRKRIKELSKKHTYKKRKNIKELPNHIIKTNDTCYCTLCKKSIENGMAQKHANSKIHEVNQTYGYNVFKIKLDTPIACCWLTCNEHFNDIDDWLAHMFLKHAINDRDCGICGEKFTCISNIKRHFYTHIKQNFYECIGCHKKFKEDGLITTHLKSCKKFNETFLKKQKEIAEQNQSNSNIGSSSSSNLGNNT
jgi:hypothetical protein